MQNHYLYILFSASANRYYVGESQDPERRLGLYNQGVFQKAFTKIAQDWELMLAHPCRSREEALKLERFVKRMKSRRFIEKVVEDPQILNRILENT
jgi:putative endonuclease